MRNIIFLLTKDCVSLEALPVYGNKYWQTPNIDELAEKGTVFMKHYSAAASTAMSFSAMLTGHYPYEFKSRKIYTAVQPSEYPSIFDTLQHEGYETHLVWDQMWMTMAWPFVREFGDERKLIIHNLDIAQRTGSGKIDDAPIFRNDNLLKITLEKIKIEIESIDYSKKQFVWLHLPHVLKGRRCYMDDMDAFDEVVSYARGAVGDNNLFITSDHGHMNMHKGQVGYGFNVYEPIIHIPLITPKIKDVRFVNDLTSNVDLSHILLDDHIIKRDYIIADTQYAWQPDRKTAIVTEQYKYIYNKKDKTEELYDLQWDPNERYNIIVDGYFDHNRNKYLLYDEYYFYPDREIALSRLSDFREIMQTFWFEPTQRELRKYKNELRINHFKSMLSKLVK